MSDAEADDAIRAAQAAIAKAAQIDRPRELGQALKRLDVLYRQACEAEATATALAVQKERNRLCSLHDGQLVTGDAEATDEALTAVEQHLRPLASTLGVADDYPLDELARLAALAIQE